MDFVQLMRELCKELDKPRKGYPKDRHLYAIPGTYQYPIDTKKRVRAALSYFSQYELDFPPDVRKEAWKRIIAAAKKFGIKVSREV